MGLLTVSVSNDIMKLSKFFLLENIAEVEGARLLITLAKLKQAISVKCKDENIAVRLFEWNGTSND